MAIFVSCPYCGGNFQIKEKYAGKKGGCPNCQKLVKVPELPTGDTTQTQGEKPPEAPAPVRARALRPRMAPGSANFLEFNCSRCDKLMKSAIKWAGKRTHCTGCGAELKIPALTMGAVSTASGRNQSTDSPLGSGEDSSVSDTSSVSLSGHDRDLETLLTEAPLKRNAPAKVRKAKKRANWSMPRVGVDPYAAYLLFGWSVLLLALVLMITVDSLVSYLMSSAIILICTVIISIRMIQCDFKFGGVFCLIFLPLCGPFVAMVSGWRFQDRLNIPGVVLMISTAMIMNIGFTAIEANFRTAGPRQSAAATANGDLNLQDGVSLMQELGPGRVAQFTISNQGGNVSIPELEQRFRRIAPQLNFRWQLGFGNPVVEVGPIEDLDELIDRIDFGNVMYLDRRLRKVTLSINRQSMDGQAVNNLSRARIDVQSVNSPATESPPRSASESPSRAAQSAPATRPAPRTVEPSQPTDPVTELLTTARGAHIHQRREALQQLLDLGSDEATARRGDIIQLGYHSLTDNDKTCRQLGFTLLQQMEVNEQPLTDAIKRAADSESLAIRQDMLSFLTAIGTPKAAEVIATHLGSDNLIAIKALVKMGDVAEPAARESLKHSDAMVRLGACRVLEKIGTTASLKSLMALSNDPGLGVRPAAEHAYRAIQSRDSLEHSSSPR